jgi:hypothetical protein
LLGLTFSYLITGIFNGSSKLLLGKIQMGTGIEAAVKAGDIIVLPAETARSSTESTPDYKYIGVYPLVYYNKLQDKFWLTHGRVVPNGEMKWASGLLASF